MERQSKVKLRHVEAFVAVAEAGSFRQAADALLVSQSALTVTVRQLEEYSGVALFNRTTRRVVLTEAGADFLPGAKRLLLDFRSVIGELETLASLDRGRVRAAALPSISAEWLPAVVARFSHDYPNIDFEIYTGNSVSIYRRLGANEVDFGFVGQILPNPEISHLKVVSQPVCLVCPPDHPLAVSSGPVEWSALAGVEFIHAGNNDSVTQVLQERPELSDTFLKTRYRSNKADIVASLIREGVGVTAVAPVVIPKEIRAGLSIVPLTNPDIHRNIYLIKRRGLSLLPASQAFMSAVFDQMRGGTRSAGPVIEDFG